MAKFFQSINPLPTRQSNINPAPILSNTSGRCILTQGTRSLLGPTISLDGGPFRSDPNHLSAQLLPILDQSNKIDQFFNALHIYQYITNSMPIQCQCKWTNVLLSFGTSLYGGKAISLDGGRFGGHHNTTSRSIEHNKNTNPTDI